MQEIEAYLRTHDSEAGVPDPLWHREIHHLLSLLEAVDGAALGAAEKLVGNVPADQPESIGQGLREVLGFLENFDFDAAEKRLRQVVSQLQRKT